MSLDNLLDSFTEEVFETTIRPVPVGTYRGKIINVEAFEGTSKKDGKPFEGLYVTYELELPEEVAQELGRTTARVRQQIFVRRTPEGRLDPKGNIQLGRLREAVGQNVGGPWAPRMLLAAPPLAVEVTQRVVEDVVYNDVASVKPWV